MVPPPIEIPPDILKTALDVVELRVSVAPPLTARAAKLNGPAPVQVAAHGELDELVVQPDGNDPVMLPDLNVTALPPVGALGEVMLATVLMRLVAPETSLLPASGSDAVALLICTDEVPDGGEIVQLLDAGLVPEP